MVLYGLIEEKDFDALFQQALIEIYENDFVAVGQIMSLWGRKTMV